MIRRRSGLLALSLLFVSLCVAGPASAVTRVFLLGGQSNMVGQGSNVELTPPYNAPQADVKFWAGHWVSLAPGYGNNSSHFGPEVAFGRAIADALPGDDIYLVKYAADGTALYNDWSPSGGPQYNAFMNTTGAALANLDNAGVQYEISGMLWMQGESDAVEQQGPAYEANLRNFIADMRTRFDTPEMPFVIGRVLSYYGGSNGHAAIVRAAQVTVADTTANVSWIDTDSFSVVDPVSNPGHYGTSGQLDLGNGFAAANMQYIPEPSTAAMLIVGIGGLAGFARRRRTP